jgi:hypothetical protein
MPTWNLPPDTRAAGSGNPPADMNAVVDVLNHTTMQRRFYIDQYGADPTGVASSDAAWTACYADALAAVITGPPPAGVIIVLGAGVYKFSIGTVQVLHRSIGLVGQGKAVTTLYTAGSTGDLVYVCDNTGGTPCAPVGGFSLYGFNAGAAANGFHFGDRPYGAVFDIHSTGWSNCAFLLKNDQNGGVGCEGNNMWGLSAKSSLIGLQCDGSSGTKAVNYCEIFMHTVACGTAVSLVNNAALFGDTFCLHGAIGSATYATSTLISVGNSGSDAPQFNESLLNIAVEVTSGSTTVFDFVFNGTAASGILDCYGGINLLPTSGTWTAGSLSGSSVFRFNGLIRGSPLVTADTAGSKYVIGGAPASLTGWCSDGQAARIDRAGSISFSADGVQALSASGTIKTATDGLFGLIPVTETGNVASMILEPPTRGNSQVTIVNRSNFTITFAASGTSHVADGVADVIAGLTARTYTYDTGTSLWYPT